MTKRLALIALFALVPIAVDAAPHVVLANSAAAIDVRDGRTILVPLRAPVTKPGTRIRYTIVATNTGDRDAVLLTPTAKIPAGETFVGASASAGPVEFSIDGGRTWSRAPAFHVRAADGSASVRPATPAEYDALRWVAQPPLAPGAKATFSYDVIVE